MAGPFYVVVSGPPGSGKSTLASALADGFGLPLLSKDIVKEALVGSFPATDVVSSRRVGRAAMEVLFAVAAVSPTGGVLEANFHRTLAQSSIRDLPGRSVEVFCRCPREVGRARYRARADGRAEGHFDADGTDDDLWHAEVNEPVAGGWPVVEVATDRPVDMAVLQDRLRELAAR